MCEDYRAAVEEDLEYDTADRARDARLACPVLVLWSRSERAGQSTTPIDIWRHWANDVSGCGIGGGHLLPEESHEEVLRELVPFLARHVPTRSGE
jgi:haloacetate dehalogenase